MRVKRSSGIARHVDLTDDQLSVVKQMEELYAKAQSIGVAFAVNESADLVAYNCNEIVDCTGFEEDYVQSGFEYLETDDLYSIFPVWQGDLYVKQKG